MVCVRVGGLKVRVGVGGRLRVTWQRVEGAGVRVRVKVRVRVRVT